MKARIAALLFAIVFLPLPAFASCERITTPVDLALQVWDTGNTVRGFRRGLIEVDPIIAPFTGPSHNDIRGEIVEGAAFDLLMFHLTRRSKTLRCLWQGADALSHLSAIFYTNGWRLQGNVFTVRW